MQGLDLAYRVIIRFTSMRHPPQRYMCIFGKMWIVIPDVNMTSSRYLTAYDTKLYKHKFRSRIVINI